MITRPLPPAEMFEPIGAPAFVPDEAAAEWVVQTFISEEGALHNPDHAHLAFANFGVLWAGVANTRQQRRIIGTCELGEPRAMQGKWAKARQEQQIIGWFGDVPDFILTFDAHYCAQASDVEFCALAEHELYHAGQELDAFGQPKFTRDGRPKFAMRGHDCEEFVGVVRRYGAVGPDVRAMFEALKRGPEIAPARVAASCGTCLLRAA